jgi:branched-chain amino acid transport system ATP-binding protein
MPEPLLAIERLSGGWGPTLVVEDLSLVLSAGETLAILGRNGVGKSTLLELAIGRARRTAGALRLAGVDLAPLPVHARARQGLGFVPQGREVFQSLTVLEHLQIAVRPGTWGIAGVLELFPRLAERQASYGNQLSGGEQQMLAIARALLANPRVLLMDEPFEGLAPLIVEYLVRAIRTIVGAGSMALVLVEQRVDIALELSNRCIVMDRGRCVHEGASAELVRDQARIASLMGLTVH